MSKLVYVSGDSYAAGTELGDNILPGWPGLQNKLDINAEWDKKRHSLYNQYDTVLTKFNKKLSWPGQLAENYKLNVINSAKGGASLSGISHRTTVDLLKLKKLNRIPDIVLIQLTTMYRYEVYKEHNSNRGILDLSVATILYNDKSPLKDIVLTSTDQDFAIKYLYELISLFNSVYGITGKYPILLSSNLALLKTVIKIKELASNSKIISDLLEISPLDKIDENNISMDAIHRTNNFMYGPAGHYEVRTHTKYSAEIYERYIKCLNS